MRVMGFCGWSGSGKTTLITRLIPILLERGLSVSTLKHSHHAFEIDKPGKDSWLHRQAGAREVMLASAGRFALIHELNGAPEPDLPQLLARMAPVDLVLAEGFAQTPVARIEVHRPELGKTLRAATDDFTIAVASPAPLPGQAIPWLPLDDAEAIADFVITAAAGVEP